MNKCLFVYGSDKSGLNTYNLKCPQILVYEKTVKRGIFYRIRYKNIIKKLNPEIRLFGDACKSEKSYIDRMLFFTLEYICRMYGFDVYSTDIALVTDIEDERIINLINNIRKFSRFLIVYTKDYGEYRLLKSTGICVRNNTKDIKEQVIIYLGDEIIIKVANKLYYDLDLFFDENRIPVNNTIFDIICREYATQNDILYLLKENYVKKVALRSK